MSDMTEKQRKEPPTKPKIRGLRIDNKSPIKQQLIDIVNAVKLDNSLDLQIRDGYLNIYYRGGSLLRISGFRGKQINIHFDDKYFERGNERAVDKSWLPESSANISCWLVKLPDLKKTMDDWFKLYKKFEREKQHQLCCKTTQHSTSPWIILDIEYAVWLHGDREDNSAGRRLCRFDMVAVKRSDLKNSGPLTVYIVEFKQGENALEGAAGLESHAKDLLQFINEEKDEVAREAFKQSVKNIVKEKAELGLLPDVDPQTKLDIQLKTMFLFFKADQSEKLKRLQPKIENTLANHGASPLFWKLLEDTFEIVEY